MRPGRWLVLGLAVLCSSCASAAIRRGRPAVTRATSPAELSVPYVSQSELLCGGAAIAMVERWWGRRGVYAEAFSHLVHRDKGGILTTDMARVMRERGWDVRALRADASRVQQSIADRVPVIALIRVATNRYHYVVIVGWDSAHVTFHDPAASPSVRLDVPDFLRRWEGADQWAMFARPAIAVATTSSAPPINPTAPALDSLPCRPWLDKAADAASLDHLEDADQFLATAAEQCASEPIVIRERAGVRFRQGNRAEALRLATQYTQRVPSDSLGWRLLASSRYLAGDAVGALQAWNHIGRPVVDLLHIDGTQRIRYRVLAGGLAIDPATVLTPTGFALAQRRLADFPSFAITRVAYAPVAGGAVEVQATVVERPLIEPPRRLLIGTALTAAFRREVWLAVHSPLRVGDVWTGQWRWQHADPRVALRVDIPTRIGVPGIVALERSWETYRFSAAIPEERRSTSSIGITAWARPDIEQRAGLRFEHWSAYGDFLTLSAGGALHKANDRLTVLTSADHAIALGRAQSFDWARARVAWAFPADRWSNTWSMRLGADAIGASAPRGLWPLAGGGLGRDIPLRAHPRIIDDLLPAERTAQRIIHGGLAGDRPLATLGTIPVSVGVFLDAANLVASGNGVTPSRFYLDGGAGLRVGATGARFPSVRVDLARGIATDRRWGVTAALVQPLPARLRTLR